MNKTLKIILFFLLFDAIVAGVYLGIKTMSTASVASFTDDTAWKRMDDDYQPQDYVEQFLKADAAQKGIFPVFIRNFGRNAAVLKLFEGKKFARAPEAVMKMVFPGLDDWTIVDIKYKNAKNREVARAVLYVSVNGQWRVGDSGALKN